MGGFYAAAVNNHLQKWSNLLSRTRLTSGWGPEWISGPLVFCRPWFALCGPGSGLVFTGLLCGYRTSDSIPAGCLSGPEPLSVSLIPGCNWVVFYSFGPGSGWTEPTGTSLFRENFSGPGCGTSILAGFVTRNQLCFISGPLSGSGPSHSLFGRPLAGPRPGAGVAPPPLGFFCPVFLST